MQTAGSDSSKAEAPPVPALSPSKSFSKLRFGKDKASRSQRLTLQHSLSASSTSLNSEDGDEMSWQIGSVAEEAAHQQREDTLPDFTILSTIGAQKTGPRVAAETAMRAHLMLHKRSVSRRSQATPRVDFVRNRYFRWSYSESAP